jgi:hypothetical protein
MPEDDVAQGDFIAKLKELAEAIKATAEAIQAVERTLEIAERSAVLEVNNTTTRKLILDDASHDHGGFSLALNPTIDANKPDVLGTRSSGFLTGTAGHVRYNVEGTGIFYTITWSVPFIGSNGTNSLLEGPGAEQLVIFHAGANGNTKVPMRYLIGEKVAAAARQADWRPCDKCKTLYFAPDVEFSDCALGGRHAHSPASLNFSLPHDIDTPSFSHQADWRMCVKCTGMFFDGSRNKGLCPSPVPPFHEGEGPYVLSHTFSVNEPADATHQPGWRFCIDCFGLFFEPTNAGGCPANQGGAHRRFVGTGTPLVPPHPLAGVRDQRPFNYRLSHDVVPDPPDHESGWRRCGQCSLLFQEADVNDSHCPKGGPHRVDGQSPVFQISRVTPPSGDFLPGWAKCRKCKVMHFDGIRFTRGTGRCPVPNPPGFRLGHKAGGFVFHLPHDFEGPGQNQWRFCTKCFGLIFEPQSGDGMCPVGGAHVLQGFDFRLSHA